MWDSWSQVNGPGLRGREVSVVLSWLSTSECPIPLGPLSKWLHNLTCLTSAPACLNLIRLTKLIIRGPAGVLFVFCFSFTVKFPLFITFNSLFHNLSLGLVWGGPWIVWPSNLIRCEPVGLNLIQSSCSENYMMLVGGALWENRNQECKLIAAFLCSEH